MTHLPHLLAALRFHERDTTGLESIRPDDWRELLEITDRERLTLPVGLRCRDSLPPPVALRVDRNLQWNANRHRRLVSAYREIAGALENRNIEFLILKGLSHGTCFAMDARYRPQYDIDIYCPKEFTARASQAIQTLGYSAVPEAGSTKTDHLPVMIRRNGWRWRGDYFDPEMPFAVELHFRFWDSRTERFEARGLERFWNGRTVHDASGLRLPALNAADRATYASLHLVRHLLRGDLRLYHVYELAYFLERSRTDANFWREWRRRDAEGSRQIEAIAFRLAREWFHCRLHADAQAVVDELPKSVRRWFELFAMSPVEAIGQPNKNELWLHRCLIEDAGHRREVAIRRLFPTSRTAVTAYAHVPGQRVTTRLRVRRFCYGTAFFVKRAIHHIRSLRPVIRDGMRWWFAQPGSQ